MVCVPEANKGPISLPSHAIVSTISNAIRAGPLAIALFVRWGSGCALRVGGAEEVFHETCNHFVTQWPNEPYASSALHVTQEVPSRLSKGENWWFRTRLKVSAETGLPRGPFLPR